MGSTSTLLIDLSKDILNDLAMPWQGGDWITLSEEKRAMLEGLVCSESAAVFQYVYTKSNVSFVIVLPGANGDLDETFEVANQMLDFIKHKNK